MQQRHAQTKFNFQLWRSESCGSRHRGGFTIVELLVVVGIIAMLIALLMPVLIAVRDQARNVLCMNNLRQLGLAVTSYAHTNCTLPSSSMPDVLPWWPWDVQNDIVDKITDEGMTRAQFYCPFTADLMNRDDVWQMSPKWHTVGYWVFLDRQCLSLHKPYLQPTKYLKQRLTDTDGNPEDSELASDATLSSTASSSPDYNNFIVVMPIDGANSSNHRDNAQIPLGGNVLYLDGHVSWRPFWECECVPGSSARVSGGDPAES